MSVWGTSWGSSWNSSWADAVAISDVWADAWGTSWGSSWGSVVQTPSVELIISTHQLQTGVITLEVPALLSITGQQNQTGDIEIISTSGLSVLSKQAQPGNIQIQIPSVLNILSEQNQSGIISIETVSGFRVVGRQLQSGDVALSIPVSLSIDGAAGSRRSNRFKYSGSSFISCRPTTGRHRTDRRNRSCQRYGQINNNAIES